MTRFLFRRGVIGALRKLGIWKNHVYRIVPEHWRLPDAAGGMICEFYAESWKNQENYTVVLTVFAGVVGFSIDVIFFDLG
jgi:hypothetical protein